MHFKSGQLRAYLDRELPKDELGEVYAHLQECTTCQEAARLLGEQARQVSNQLDYLTPRSLEDHAPPHTARVRFDQYIHNKEKRTMLSKLSATKFRPAWIIAGLILFMAVAPPSHRYSPGGRLPDCFVLEITVAVNPGSLPNSLIVHPAPEILQRSKIRGRRA
jgi:anti-sigma factor RsiW